jgi:hypothetical protein
MNTVYLGRSRKKITSGLMVLYKYRSREPVEKWFYIKIEVNNLWRDGFI